MRPRKIAGFFVLTTATVGVLFACGGDAKPGPAAPAAATASSGPSGTTHQADTTTTTTALGDGGDLLGAKLTTTNRKEVETKGDAGSKGPGRSDEPGRKREDIQTTVQAHRDEARACYDAGLKDHPGIEGDLFVNFLIDPQGVVTEVTIDHGKSSIHEETVGNCVMGVIKKLSFAPSAKGFESRASYPFNFHPKSGPAGKK